ncbi:MAG: hypothetical protein OHK0032_05910 [Thermodesulfovibrionales bacterium]
MDIQQDSEVAGEIKKGFIFIAIVSLFVMYPLAAYCGGMSDSKPGFNSNAYTIERLIFKKVNRERRRYGLKMLRWDPKLADIARQHSLDMANNGLLSHRGSNGEGTITRIRERGAGGLIGENIGMMPIGNIVGYGYVSSPKDIAHAMTNMWMKSPDHRANILNSGYNSTGIGAAYDGRGAYYITQDFK